MNFLLKGALLLVTLFFMFSCEGEDGAVGLQGEQGPQGETGLPGDQGATGTVNVIYSEWINIFPDPVVSTDFSSIEIPELTNAIVDSGVVLVYGKEEASGDGVVTSIPTSNNLEEYSFELEEGKLILIVRNLSGITSKVSVQRARYIIIPGSIAASKNSIPTDFAALSYQEIQSMFIIN